jgi:hypothetical protein
MDFDEFDFQEREDFDFESGEIPGLAVIVDLPKDPVA